MSISWDNFELLKQMGLDAYRAGKLETAQKHLLEARRVMHDLSRATRNAGAAQSRRTAAEHLSALAQQCVLDEHAAANASAWPDLVAWAQRTNVPISVGRGEELQRLFAVCGTVGRPNTLLVGPQGVGKTSLVDALAKHIAEREAPFDEGQPKKILIVDAATLTRNDAWYEELESLFATLSEDGDVLFFDDLPTAGPLLSDLLRALKELKHRLKPSVLVLAAVTPDTHARMLELQNYFHTVIRLEPLSAELTRQGLELHRLAMERDYAVRVADEALANVVRLSSVDDPGTALPGSAVALLRRVCQAVAAAADGTDTSPTVGANAVVTAVAKRTGIRNTLLARFGKKAAEHLSDVRAVFATAVPDQPSMVASVCNALQHRTVLGYAVGNNARFPHHKPEPFVGPFLFIGPTGTGKTRTAKVIAEYLFNKPEALVVLRCYRGLDGGTTHASSAAAAIRGGDLFELVRADPHRVFLIEEVARADHRFQFDIAPWLRGDQLPCDRTGEPLLHFLHAVLVLEQSVDSAELTRHLGRRPDPDSDSDTLPKRAAEMVASNFPALAELYNRCSIFWPAPSTA